MPTPGQLRRQAAYLRAHAEGELAKAARTADRIRAEAEVLEEAAKKLEVLRNTSKAISVNDVQQDIRQSLNISAAKSVDPLAIAARNADPPLTLRRLAIQVGVKAPVLTMARQGIRPIRRAVAEAIAELTGFAATTANWPGGILD